MSETGSLPGAEDTICAIATAPGAGGIAIVRVSGPDALAVAGRVTGRDPSTLEDRRAIVCVARDPQTGQRIDQILLLVMRGPRSFTGEDVAELHGHGGSLNAGRLVRAALAAGARQAEPGEFTRRAFVHGRMDLTRAEAVLAVIGAASERALAVAQAQLEGQLGRVIGELREQSTELLADLEAGMDFPEEGNAEPTRAEYGQRAAELARRCHVLEESYRAGRALREGVSVALAGPVNAGKSSLFNALVGSERALVAEEPGTTRDFVEAQQVWSGLPVTLIDTAGLREGASELERRGIELGRKRAERADLVIELWPRGDRMEAGSAVSGNRLRVVSKGDADGEVPSDWLVTSAKDGQGIDELKAMVVALAVGRAGEEDQGVVVTSERQRGLLARAKEAFERARDQIATDGADEIVALEVREGREALGLVLAVPPDDAVLDALFARFCIGK